MAKSEAPVLPQEAPNVEAPPAGSPPAGTVGLTQEQFRTLLEAVRPPAPPDVVLDLANDPNVWTWDRVRDLIESGEARAVEFVPDQSVMLGWNCLYVWVSEGEVNTVPEMHYNVYMNSRSDERRGREDVQRTLLKRVGSDGGKPFASFTTGWNGHSDSI